MVFSKIANGITKHYKIVIVAWIVALLISVPAILQVDKAVQYEVTFDAGEEYESIRANEIIAEEFQTSVANGTLLILLQADDVTNAIVRDFVLALQERIDSSQELKYLIGTSSVYSYATMAIEQIAMELGPVMRPTEQDVGMGAFLLWGVPAMHVANWTESFSDSQAYNSTIAQLSAYLSQINADANTTALAFGYYNAFVAAWNATIMPNPMDRATACVRAVAPTLIDSLPPEQSEMKEVLTAVLNSFDLTSFGNETRIHSLALVMIGSMASITNTTLLQEVYDLGPGYDDTEVRTYARSVIGNGTLSTYPYTMPEQLVDNFVSPSNKSMLLMVTFTVAADHTESDGEKPMIENVGVLRELIGELMAGTGADVIVYVTGDAAISADMEAISADDMKMIEPITIIIIIVLMGILFRSVVAQFLPLGAVGVAIGMSQALVFVIGSTVAQINYTVLTLLFAVLLGVGTDYSIFIVTRYREERIKGATRERAVHTAVTWAGESIVTSGATVIIAFFAMALSSFSFVQTMGLLLGMSIVVALLVALTLVPAILMLVGNHIFWPTTGKRWDRFAQNLMRRKGEGNHGYFHRAASFAVDHAKIVIIAAILVSIPTTYVFVTEETSFDFIGCMGDSESIEGMNAMTEDFGAGRIMPTQIVVTGDTVVYGNGTFDFVYLDALDNITATIASDPMIQTVTGVTRPYGEWIDYRNLSALPVETRAQIEDAMLQFVGNDSTSALFTVVLKEQPQKASAVNHMAALREEIDATKATLPVLANSTILVGGSTAMLYDMGLSTSEQFTNIEIIVVIGIFIVLMVVLGSLLLPAFAVVSIAMSITWSFAATAFVFGDILGKPILWIIPLVLFVMLMGIGMDYNVFILTRIREEIHKGKEMREGIVDAVDWTGGIITALALIMAGAFGSIMLSSNAMLQEFGFALLLAVLLDAMVVRTYIVPAAIVLIGKWAWWAPGRLQRVGREEKRRKPRMKDSDLDK